MSTRLLNLGLLGTLLITGGSLHGGDDPNAIKAPEVPVSQPVVREVTDHEDFTGRIDAVQSVDLRARVTGYLTKVTFQAGSSVKQGDMLFEIDPRPYEAALDAATAEVARAEAHLKLATANLERARELLKKGAITQEDYNKAVGDAEEAKAALTAAQASREIHKLNLSYTKIAAPIAGKIGQPLLTIGNLVVADKTPLARIISIDPVYVYFDVDERTQLRLARLKRKGDKADALPVHMGLADEEGYPHDGKVDFVDTQVNAKTGTIRWRAVFANADDLFKPGMFARARLTIGGPHKAMLVPESAVVSEQGKKYLFIVSDKNVAERRLVKVGGRHDDLREVTEGLTGEDWVVVKGWGSLTTGETVTPKKVEKQK